MYIYIAIRYTHYIAIIQSFVTPDSGGHEIPDAIDVAEAAQVEASERRPWWTVASGDIGFLHKYVLFFLEELGWLWCNY
jgi:hypothetical protein